MFASSTQPGLLSIFSSTGSNPLQLFSCRTDGRLPADSFIHLLHDASNSPGPNAPASMVACQPERDGDHALDQTVLHIQSPTIRTTYIRCPRYDDTRGDLGVRLPCVHVQVRVMSRPWAFEVGVVDRGGRRGVVRCSTFQKEPRITGPDGERVLHVPVVFASRSTGSVMSGWTTIRMHLPSVLGQFSVLAGRDGGGTMGTYSHVSYVKVYATCRLRRVWFSEMSGADQMLPWEFEMYGASA